MNLKVCAVVCFFILFDIITGFVKATYLGSVNSTALRKGLFHKLSEILALLAAGMLEYGAQYIDLGIDLHVLTAVATYICLTELVSILENLGEINPTLKRFFKSFLQKLKTEEDDS